MPAIHVPVVRLPHYLGEELPAYASSGAAGLDIRAALTAPLTLKASNYAMIPSGLAMAIPQGFEIQVRPRSGLAAKHGVTVLNSPGTIDSDYRGEVKVILINHGTEDFVIEPGERIAQLVLASVVQLQWQVVTELDQTNRGAGGFGSTGTA